MGYEKTLSSVKDSQNKLGVGPIDLVLLHWPGEFVRRGEDGGANAALRRESWKALEQLQREGVVATIGVANFGERHLKELLTYASVKPVVNQFEVRELAL